MEIILSLNNYLLLTESSFHLLTLTWFWNFLISMTLGSVQRRQWQPTLVFLPGKSHGRRSLVGCSPWGPWELDMTERLHFHFSLSCIGEGNGGPLQCSCLENPRDGGAWWAAAYGVAQSRTRLKRQQQQQQLLELSAFQVFISVLQIASLFKQVNYFCWPYSVPPPTLNRLSFKHWDKTWHTWQQHTSWDVRL